MSLTRCPVGLAVALGVLVVLGGCSDPPPPPAPAAPASVPSAPPAGAQRPPQHAEVSFVPPKGFVPVSTKKSPAVAAAYALPPDGSNTPPPTVSMVVTPIDGDLSSEVAAGRQLVRTMFRDYQNTLDEPITLPSGQPGWLSGGSFTLEGTKVRNAQLLVVDRNYSYVLTGVTPIERFGNFEQAFRAMFNTFELQ